MAQVGFRANTDRRKRKQDQYTKAGRISKKRITAAKNQRQARLLAGYSA